ncbi:unnamed protein product [Ilex paraguariensis]|uniref:Uncharacterized protein n=1 Tax=Ilex paraguariensis TaxID=185542 RepID=A0ABC8U0V3_9AQUA
MNTHTTFVGQIPLSRGEKGHDSVICRKKKHEGGDGILLQSEGKRHDKGIYEVENRDTGRDEMIEVHRNKGKMPLR